MSNQRIAIIGGTGDQGKGLALRLARAGFEIIIGSRDRERARTASAEMRAVLAASGSGGSGGADSVKLDGEANADAAAKSSIIVLTIPFAAHISTLKEIREKIQPGAL